MNSFIIKILIWISILTPAHEISAQDFGTRLILDRYTGRNRTVYTIGDRIIMKLRADKREFNGIITNLYDSVVVLEDVFIKLNQIDYIRTEHTRGLLSPGNGPKLVIAGIGLFLIDQFNYIGGPGNSFNFSRGIAVTSGALIGFGLFMASLRSRKFHPGKNRRIRITDY